MRMRRTVLGALALVLTAAGVSTGGATASAAPAEAPAFEHYVALGDSYTSGPLIPWQQLTWCLRSSNNYPSWLATKLGIYYTPGAFTDASCGGADTTHMTQPQTIPAPSIPLGTNQPQFASLKLDTDLVTIGLGGNNYGVFGSLITKCPELRSADPTGSPCKDHYTANGVDAMAEAIADTEEDIEEVIRGVKERSPAAKVVLVGYPRLLPPTGYCPDQIPFADGDYRWADSVERKLNAALARAAKTTRVLFVDTYGPSLGHDACSGSAAWVNGQYNNLFAAAAYHPTAAGMQGEANLVYNALTGNTDAADTAAAVADVHAAPKKAESGTVDRSRLRSVVPRVDLLPMGD